MKEAVQNIISSASGSVKSLRAFRSERKNAMNCVSRLDSNIYMMNYNLDYDLDGLLEKGVSNTAELLAFAAKTTVIGSKFIKIGSSDFGCSTFNAVTEKGDYIMGRNFDYKSAPCMVLWTHPENGYASLSMVDCNFMLYGNVNKPVLTFNRLQVLLAPYCCVDGMNEKGLSIAVVELKTSATNQNTGKKNITTTTVIRAVLDKCATVEEAIELFSRYDMHDAFFCCYHYQISDASGKSVILEYVNNEMRLFYPEKRETASSDYQYCANFFLSEDGDNSKGFGYDRYETMGERLDEKNGILTEREAMGLLAKVHLDYQHETYPWRVTTLWSAVYNSSSLDVCLAANLDYTRVYRLNVAAPLKAQRA